MPQKLNKKTTTAKDPSTPARRIPVVLQIIPHLGAGGAEQGCLDVAAGLVKSGAKSIVICNGGARVPELQRHGSTYIQLPVDSKNPMTMFLNIGRIRKIIQEYKVDIVHVRSRAPAWSAYYACKDTPAKFMTTCHAPYNIHGKRLKRFYNSSIVKGERIIAISDFIADYIQKNYIVDSKKVRTIHRGVSLDKFHPQGVTAERMIKLAKAWRIPDGAVIVMLPGRLTRWKGQTVMIDAIAKLNRPDIFCVLVGADQGRSEYRIELENLIKAHGMESHVRLMDHCDDMPSAYMLANIVVSASTDPEGFGRIAIEGQAMGRPVIATDHGGSKETIIRGETGWLVEPGNADDLTRALKEALALTPEQRDIMAGKAMAHIAQHFSKEHMIDETLKVYTELLQEKWALETTSWAQAA